MGVVVRKAELDELETLMEWRMRVLAEVFSIPEGEDVAELRAANEAYYREHLADGAHTACFAEDEAAGAIIGCGGICYQAEMPSPDNPSGMCGYLMNIYTSPDARGRGVGRAVVEFLLADAAARGTGKVYLESSEVAMQLYRSLGFEDMVGYMKLG